MCSLTARLLSWLALLTVASHGFEPTRLGMAFLFAACILYEHSLDEKDRNRNKHR
mgnify:CR=1 FL=1